MGQMVKDKQNNHYLISEVVDGSTIKIPTGIRSDLSNCYIVPQDSTFLMSLESCIFKETYSIGVHTKDNYHTCIYLYSIMTFILLRYKEEYLEKRGFDRSVLMAGPMSQNPYFDDSERVFSRTIGITGYTRNYWPKLFSERIQGDIEETVSGTLGSSELTEFDNEEDDSQGWL
jgi:hypothetical protein